MCAWLVAEWAQRHAATGARTGARAALGAETGVETGVETGEGAVLSAAMDDSTGTVHSTGFTALGSQLWVRSFSHWRRRSPAAIAATATSLRECRRQAKGGGCSSTSEALRKRVVLLQTLGQSTVRGIGLAKRGLYPASRTVPPRTRLFEQSCLLRSERVSTRTPPPASGAHVARESGTQAPK